MANELEIEMRKFLFGYLDARGPEVATETELEAVMVAVYCPLGRGGKRPPPKEVKETLYKLLQEFREEGKVELGWKMNPRYKHGRS